MEKEIYAFKSQLKEIIDKEKMKLWLAKKEGRRVDYVFKVGSEQFLAPEEIAKDNDYVLFGQNIKESYKKDLVLLFNQYFS